MAVAKAGPDERGLDQRVQAQNEQTEEQPELGEVPGQHRRPGQPRKDIRWVLERHVDVDPLTVEQGVRRQHVVLEVARRPPPEQPGQERKGSKQPERHAK
jgi:hypothetical protein